MYLSIDGRSSLAVTHILHLLFIKEFFLRYINTFVAPQQLLTSKQFKESRAEMQDNLALYCTALLACGGPDTLDNQFQQVSRARLKAYVSDRQVQKVCQTLKQANIIECDGTYSHGRKGSEKALGYKFTKQISSSDFQRYSLLSKAGRDRFAKSKVITAACPQWKDSLNGVYRALADRMTLFEIDEQAAVAVMSGLPLYNQPSAEYQLAAFLAGRYFATVGKTSRFYSSLANMRKDLRKLLYVPSNMGRRWCVIPDVSCCQPLLLSHFVQQYVEKQQFERYVTLTETGSLYDEIAGSIECSRSEVKQAISTYLCGPWIDLQAPVSNRINRLGADAARKREVLLLVAKWFGREFPDISSYLKQRKTQAKKGRSRSTLYGPPYAVVAYDLQKLEAAIVIQGCCARLIQHHPELPFTPIHDGILVPDDHSEIVIEELRSSFKAIGRNPAIKCEPHSHIISNAEKNNSKINI